MSCGGLRGSVVEADNRTDKCSRCMYFGLSVELRPSGVNVPHLSVPFLFYVSK